MIEASALTKVYGTQPVLRGVNLRIAAGEFVTLVGPNGAGKTTLIRIVATLLKPSAGSLTIGGWPLATHADRVRRHIGFLSHQPLVYGDLTAADNLHFFAKLYALDRPEERVRSALKQVGLHARQQDFVRTFSRGMLQRLAIARATLHEPEVLLLDEPYTGLDQTASSQLDALLQAQQAGGRTIFMITHDLLHGLTLCDRIAILKRGKIVRELKRGAVTEAEFVALYRSEIEGGNRHG